MKNFVIINLIICFSYLSGATVSINQATIVANNIFIEKNPLHHEGDFSVSSLDIISDNSIPLMYLFHLEPRGFILVAGDDKAIPNLAYSLDNIFLMENM